MKILALFLSLLCLGFPVLPADIPGMVLIPDGEFWMGRTVSFQYDEFNYLERARRDDRPEHRVRLNAYYIDKYEVMNEHYSEFAEATGRKKPFHWIGGKPSETEMKLPVTNVDYDDAQSYCAWAGKRLPTEAEWERAARGDLERAMYSWGNDLGSAKPANGSGSTKPEDGKVTKKAHYGSPNGPAPVGSYPPNGFGLYDMTGNVWEWVSDWYEREYYSVSPRENPKGPEIGTYRVVRGGGWSDQDLHRQLAVYYRNYTDDFVKTSTIGFRCAKSF